MCLISDVSPENIAISTGVYILYDSQKKTDFHLKCHFFCYTRDKFDYLKIHNFLSIETTLMKFCSNFNLNITHNVAETYH